MLRLRDDGSGDLAPVSPARRGELTTYVVLAPDAGPDLSGLRGFLLADLVGRAAARHGLRVSAWHSVPDEAHEDWRAAYQALNIYPAQYAAEPPDPLDIGIDAARPGPAAARGSRWLRPGSVLAAGIDATGGGPADRDPLTVRLALLGRHYREPARLGPGELSAAGDELRRWRERVAHWATFPSKPMCAGYLGQVAKAFDDDLDTPAALAALRALVRDEGIPEGSKFETFAYLDRLLGLDLARDVGR